MSLGPLLAEVATNLEGVTSVAGSGGVGVSDGVGYRIGVGEPFAYVDEAGVASFRLDPAVAAAARRTPDTSASDRGPDWVRFAPAELDPFAADRAVAWFESAARRAGARG